jgi:hypothetical protein
LFYENCVDNVLTKPSQALHVWDYRVDEKTFAHWVRLGPLAHLKKKG